MAGKTPTDKPQTAATKPAAVKPGPKARASSAAGSGGKDSIKTGLEHLATAPGPKAEAAAAVPAHRQVFLENMAHALIFDIFQMQTVLHAIRDISAEETEYFLDFYASRLKPLLVEDIANGAISALLDLGVWYALEGQEEILTVGLERRLGDINITNGQIKQLAIEAVYGNHRDENPSRGERWMPSLHRNSSREDVERCAPGHGSRRGERDSRRAR
jgi:hypothetical protein